jgi:hypothetical protein
MEDIKIIYSSDYEEYILINYFNNIIKKNNKIGKFILNNNLLEINWNNEIIEYFIKIEKIYLDEADTYIFKNNNLELNDITINYIINNEIVYNSYKINKSLNKLFNYKNDIYDIQFNNKFIFLNNIKYINIFDNNYYTENFILINIIINNTNNTIFNYILCKTNNIIYDKNNCIIFKYELIDLNLKINSKIYILNENNIYIEMPNNFNIKHDKWEDVIVLNNNTKEMYRVSNNEKGKFEINNNILNIFWDNWGTESFIEINNIYYLFNYINIHHNHWSEKCIIENDLIIRSSNKNEFGKFLFDNDKLIIYWEKWNEETFYKVDNEYYYKDLVKNQFLEKKIILKKRSEKEVILLDDNIIINHFNNKKGTYILDNLNTLTILWDEKNTSDIYILINNKYYYKDYIDNNEKDYILVNNEYLNDKFASHKVKLDYFSNKLKLNNIYYAFFQKNKIFYVFDTSDKVDEYESLKIYNLYIINNINYLIINDLYLKIKDHRVNLNIFKTYNPKFKNLDDNQLFINLLFNSHQIFSIESFIYKNYFFNLEGYKNNNYLQNYEESIIHWYNNNKLASLFFYSNDIEIIYDNIDLRKKYYLDNIFIINLNNDNDLKKVFDNIPKKSNIILNFNFNTHNFVDNKYNIYEKFIINNFNNLIITKSYNKSSCDVIKFINKILNKNNFEYIFYIKDLISDIINLDFRLDLKVYSKVDLIEIIIYKYLLDKIFNLYNNNLILNSDFLSVI